MHDLVTGLEVEEAVTQATELPAADMTEGSCVALFRILIAWVLRQRFSQEHYSACLDRDEGQEWGLIDRLGALWWRATRTRHQEDVNNKLTRTR